MQNTSPTFCVMPWMNLGTETNGKCKICCVVQTDSYIKKQDGTDFHLHEDAIEEIFNSDYLREVRRKMLAGEEVLECAYCTEQTKLGQATSPRVEYNRAWLSEELHECIKYSTEHDGQVPRLPISLEPRPGNTCNLKCNSCWSLSSSKVLAERKSALNGVLGEVPEFLRQRWGSELEKVTGENLAWSQDEKYLRNFQKVIPGLHRLYFTGGEPTLIPSNLAMLRELLAQGKRDTLISFTTNLTNFSSELWELLDQFERVEITGSIDGFGAANEYLRYPSRWPIVAENLERLARLRPRVRCGLISVVQIANLYNLVDLMKWLGRSELLRPISIFPSFLNFLAHLSLRNLPPGARKRALDFLSTAAMDPEISPENQRALAQFRSALEAPPAADAEKRLKEFREYTNFIDRSRGLRFADVFPRFTDLLNE
jgi:sulfatase maturation enzyme AslB (radical SAM superfamily)